VAYMDLEKAYDRVDRNAMWSLYFFSFKNTAVSLKG